MTKRGRPELTDERFRRESFNCRLPRWLIEWLQRQPGNMGQNVESAVIKANKLKKPK